MIITIDIAHPPHTSKDAARVLDETLRKATLSGRVRVLKIIHGYGSTGKGGTLKTLVANWAYTRRGNFSLIVPGEKFSPFNGDIQDRMKESGLPGVSHFGEANEGVTFLFLK